jgi:outer membrane biosynthesis protein TonB
LNSFLDAHKALIITLLISATVVLLAFSVHIKRRTALVAETYFEMDAEEYFEEEKEELEEIIKSIDQLTTNEAFNETKEMEELDDAEFEKRLEEIRNRIKSEPPRPEPKPADNDPGPEDTTFDDINDLIEKQKNKGLVNKNSSISYSLVDRSHNYLPTPVYLCEYGGKIVVNITVNADGIVIDAYVNNTSSSTNGCLIDHALEYARASQFNSDPSKPSQLGTITFLFRGKY